MRRPVLLVLFLCCLVLPACTATDASSAVARHRPDAVTRVEGRPGGEGRDAAARLARAPAVTAASGTARTILTATVTGLPGRTEPIVFRGRGAIDFAAGRSRSVLEMASAGSGSAAGAIVLESVVADDLLYVRGPSPTSGAEPSAPWVRIDPTATRGGDGSGSGAPDFGPLAALAGSDIGAPLALLAGVDASSVRAVATETAGGATTTTLRAMVDPVAATAGGATAHERAVLESFLDGIGAHRLHVEAELDEDDRLRRLVYEHAAPTPAGPVRQRFDMQYADFGATVEISVPPRHQVRDLSEGPGSAQGPR